MKNMPVLKSSIFIGTFLVVLYLGLVGGVWPGNANSTQQSEIQVENRTQAFQVVNMERSADYLRVWLSNNYNKGINGYTIAVGTNLQITKDLTIANRVIEPGGTDEFRVSADNLNGQQNLRVLAVIFEDGTTDGDPSATQMISNRRLGLRSQLERILPLILRVLNSPNPVNASSLQQLRSQIASLPSRPDATLPAGSLGGLHDMKEELFSEIEEIRRRVEARSDRSYRDELIRLRERLLRRHATLSGRN